MLSKQVTPENFKLTIGRLHYKAISNNVSKSAIARGTRAYTNFFAAAKPDGFPAHDDIIGGVPENNSGKQY